MNVVNAIRFFHRQEIKKITNYGVTVLMFFNVQLALNSLKARLVKANT